MATHYAILENGGVPTKYSAETHFRILNSVPKINPYALYFYVTLGYVNSLIFILMYINETLEIRKKKHVEKITGVPT